MDRQDFELAIQQGLIDMTSQDHKPPDFSDAGNAEAFIRTYQEELIYTDAIGWLHWNGKTWESGNHTVERLAVDFTGQMLSEAKQAYKEALYDFACSDSSTEMKRRVADTKEFLNHAKRSRMNRTIRDMLRLSQSALVIPADRLDAGEAELNTPAGIVDLKTGRVRPHDRNALCSKITAVAPGTAGAAQWVQFLEEITAGDDSLIGFLQLVVGMALFGKVYAEGMVVAYGAGKNGKSTFFNVVAAVLGAYAGTLDVGVLTTDRQNRGAALATLRGKRLIVAGELEEGKRLSVSTVKQICSTDRITIEEKYRSPESIIPSHTLVMYTNHLPRVGSMDPGTWRRLWVVPFNARISDRETISNYGDYLSKNCGPAILAWAIQGAVNFAKNGYRLDIPEAVETFTDQYRQRENWFENFIDECCIREPDARVGAADLYQAYRDWSVSNGDYVRRLPDFNAAMESAGYVKINPKNRKTWVGIRIDFQSSKYHIL